MNILECLDDANLFGSALRDASTWARWRSFLCALFGKPMSDAEAETYRACTGRTTAPETPFTEAWLVCGRRAGKSFTLALIAVFLACFKDYATHLGPGERATVMVIATDRKQARVIFRYVRGLLSIPMLKPLIEREAAESIDLNNGVTIEIAVASYRTTRGYTLAAVLCDEIAFWRSDDAAEPDYAILDALRPGLGTLPGAMLLCASSPYAQSGALYDAYRRYHGQDDAPVLIWHAATRFMNATFPEATIAQAMERDPASAAAEYLAEFRTDVQAFVTREAVEACVSRGVFERPPIEVATYVGFVDPSGGASDSFSVAVAHFGKRHCGSRLCARTASAVFPRGRCFRICRHSESLSCRHGSGRPLCWRMAARGVPQARHRILRGTQAQERNLSRGSSRDQFKARRPARRSKTARAIHRPGASHGSGRSREHRPSPRLAR